METKAFTIAANIDDAGVAIRYANDVIRVCPSEEEKQLHEDGQVSTVSVQL